MKRLVAIILAAGFCIVSLLALNRGALAIPPIETPQAWEYQALQSLAADGVLRGFHELRSSMGEHQTRRRIALSLERAWARMQEKGASNISPTDRDTLRELMIAFKDDAAALGMPVRSISDAFSGTAKQPVLLHSLQLSGAFILNASGRQRSEARRIDNSPSTDPFLNAFLTSPDDNNPFEHDRGPGGDLFRFDSKFTLTYPMTEHLTLALPVRIIPYGDSFTQLKYAVQPAVVLRADRLGALSNAYFRGGQLDNLQSSMLGLTYRGPDPTQQGPGFQNPVQPYENGVSLGGMLDGQLKFQFSFGELQSSLVNSFPNLSDPTGNLTMNNYFMVVNPSPTSPIQFGGPNSVSGPTRIDTFDASAGPLPSVYLSSKASLGSVYIASVDGIACPPNGAGCPIGPGAWYYIDKTNQIVFQSPLPVGTSVQVGYSVLGQGGNNGDFPSYRYDYHRYHFNARVQEEIKAWHESEVGLSVSRIFDSYDFGGTQGARFGNGYGAISDTVFGLDAKVPLCFIKSRKGHFETPELFGEAAYSKFTPDFHNTPAITDSALAVGLRLKVAGVSETLQYQAVGPNFLDGAPLRYLGPAPATFQFWHGNYFPEFFGFGNNLAINRIFDDTVTPGCSGTACTSQNPQLTYIYPVFNPFEASDPQYYSAFAPNTQGFTSKLSVPIRKGEHAIEARITARHLWEMVPNGFGQLAYGPGFASDIKLTSDKLGGGLQFGLPVMNREAHIGVMWSLEHLYRHDKTAYSYVPFNPAAGGPDASSAAALNAYLALGNLPVLFYPNYVDEFHSVLSLNLTVPLTRDLNFGLKYDPQTYRGTYATTLNETIKQHKDGTTLTLNYNLPKTANSLVFLYKNTTYSDSVLPSYNFNQNREDLNFIIRF